MARKDIPKELTQTQDLEDWEREKAAAEQEAQAAELKAQIKSTVTLQSARLPTAEIPARPPAAAGPPAPGPAHPTPTAPSAAPVWPTPVSSGPIPIANAPASSGSLPTMPSAAEGGPAWNGPGPAHSQPVSSGQHPPSSGSMPTIPHPSSGNPVWNGPAPVSSGPISSGQTPANIAPVSVPLPPPPPPPTSETAREMWCMRVTAGVMESLAYAAVQQAKDLERKTGGVIVITYPAAAPNQHLALVAPEVTFMRFALDGAVAHLYSARNRQKLPTLHLSLPDEQLKPVDSLRRSGSHLRRPDDPRNLKNQRLTSLPVCRIVTRDWVGYQLMHPNKKDGRVFKMRDIVYRIFQPLVATWQRLKHDEYGSPW